MMQLKLAIISFSLSFQTFAMLDSGLPTLTLDTGSRRPTGLMHKMVEVKEFGVEDSALEMAPGDLCFAQVAEPEQYAGLFAVWSPTPAQSCRTNRIPQQNTVLIRLGKILSKSGKVMGPDGGKVSHLYQAEHAETDRVVGKIQLTTDYLHGVKRRYTLHSMCGDEGGCKLTLAGPLLSIEN